MPPCLSLTRMKSVWYVESISTETWCSASGAITDRAILVTPVAWGQPGGSRPLDTTLSTNHVESATCMNSEGGSSARDKGHWGRWLPRARHSRTQSQCQLRHCVSHCPLGEERTQDRTSPRRRDSALGVQMSPIHRWNEPGLLHTGLWP